MEHVSSSASPFSFPAEEPDTETLDTSSIGIPEEDTGFWAASQPVDDTQNPEQLQEYEILFRQRPRGLAEKAVWLLHLEEERGQTWYNNFFRWYTGRLHRPRVNLSILATTIGFQTGLTALRKNPSGGKFKQLTDRLAMTSIGDTPDFYLGQHNGYTIGLVLHGSALDPPIKDIETFNSLGVQYAHPNMFAGLRFNEPSKADICVLVLGKSDVSLLRIRKATRLTAQGNLHASLEMTGSIESAHLPLQSVKKGHWFDTKYILALDVHQVKYYIIYKYEVYEVEYSDDGGEIRNEEPEQKEVPKFCHGPDGFTVAVWEPKKTPIRRWDQNIRSAARYGEIRLRVVSTKKPSLAVAGFKDTKDPYVPVFSPRDR